MSEIDPFTEATQLPRQARAQTKVWARGARSILDGYARHQISLARICILLLAASSASANEELIKTKDGKVYPHSFVFDLSPEGLVINGDSGFVTIPYAKLSPELKAKYGYDEKELAKYLKHGVDGIYSYSTGFTGEQIELQAGRFKHSSYSDNGGLVASQEGTFVVKDHWVLVKFATSVVYPYVLTVIDGHLALYGDSAYLLLKKRGTLEGMGPKYFPFIREELK